MGNVRYTILGWLAGGGLADILLARMGDQERPVAVKRVHPEYGHDPQFAKQLSEDARVLAQLAHPNLVKVLDAGRLAGTSYLAMEYVHGEDLRALFDKLATQGRQLAIGDALELAAGLLGALHYLHERVPSHADLTPANVMIGFAGDVKLLDYAVAKAAHHAAEARAETIKRERGYLSPEQCQDNDTDPRSDVFSVGVILHELLAGRRLYRRESDFATNLAIVTEAPAKPSVARPEVSAALDELVLRALAKDPAQRFASAAQMREAIVALAEREQHVMSDAGLAQLVREVCGERPEPWTLPSEAPPLTISSEPLADAKAPTTEDRAADAQLLSVPSLRPGAVRQARETAAPSSSTARPSRAPTGSPAARQTPAPPRRTPAAGVVVIPPRAATMQIPVAKVPPVPPSKPDAPRVAATTKGAAIPPSRPNPPLIAVAQRRVPTAPPPLASTAPPPPSPAAATKHPTPHGVTAIAPPASPPRQPTPPGVTAVAPPPLPRHPTPAGMTAIAPPGHPAPAGMTAIAAPTRAPTPPPMPIVRPPIVAEAPELEDDHEDEDENDVTIVSPAALDALVDAPFELPPSALPIDPADMPPPAELASGTPVDAKPAPARSRLPLIIGGVVAVLVVALLVVKLTGGSEPSAAPPADAPRVAVAPPADAAEPIDAAEPVDAAELVDAAEAAAVVDAPAPRPPVDAGRPAPQGTGIAAAAQAGDWAVVAERCAAAKVKTPSERLSCGLAACKTGKRAAALVYRNSVGNPAAIERACKENGLDLPPRQQPLQDPCEVNPLRCRK